MSTPAILGATLSGLALSTLVTWCHVVQSRDVSPHNFDGLAMSGLAISVAPYIRLIYLPLSSLLLNEYMYMHVCTFIFCCYSPAT